MSTNTYTGLFEPLSSTAGGIGPEIVRTLRAYNKALPLAFLAHVLRRSGADLEADVRRLEASHVVRREGENVVLVG